MENTIFDKRNDLEYVSRIFFHWVKNLPPNIRQDDKYRPGIETMVMLASPNTSEDIMTFSVGYPSRLAQYYMHEKAIRTNMLGDFSSQNSQDIGKRQFTGCVAIELDGEKILASVSGLKAAEDVALAVLLLAEISGLSPMDVCLNIKAHNGKLPDWFNDPRHYLYKRLFAN